MAENLIIEFNQEREIFKVPEKSVTATKIIITEMIDKPKEKKVLAYTEGLPGYIILWEGSDYDAIGDWTNKNVIDRVNELYNNG
jgi:hypothetical protein